MIKFLAAKPLKSHLATMIPLKPAPVGKSLGHLGFWKGRS
jgi:hypothetical protein